MAGSIDFLFYSFLRQMGTGRVFHAASRARRAELTKQLVNIYGNQVQTGPFAGMKLPVGKTWEDGYRAPKLLGCYETDLQPDLLKAVGRAPGTIINIGCAEGYYAVGLARLLPDAMVFAFDIDSAAAAVCRQAAELNGVGKRLEIKGLCTALLLAELVARDARPLVFMDIEGGELQLLDPKVAPGLGNCDIIVETHDFVERSITATLQERFASSHTVRLVTESARDPNQFVQLHRWWETDRWLVIDEGRPETMKWLVCWAKGSGRG